MPANVSNCLQVSEASATICAVCDQGYYLTLDGQCEPCKSGCLACAFGAGKRSATVKASPDVCLHCVQGLVPNTTDPGACVPPAVLNCATISQTSATVCEVCDPTFALSTNGSACLPCGPGCAQCHATSPSDTIVCDVASCNPATNTICPTNQCSNLQVDPINCGSCGIVCPAGAVCQAGACVCPDNGQPVAPAVAATCGTTYTGLQATSTYKYTVKNGTTYGALYDSFQIPDRFIVRANSACGPLLVDTSFTGEWRYGCLQSAPCCPDTLGGTCGGTGAALYCPPNETAGGPPGGAGKGTIASLPVPAGSTQLYVTAFGVCGGTQNEFTLTGPAGGACPGP